MLKIFRKKLVNEALSLRRTIDYFGQNRIFVVSDSEDPEIAKNETKKTKDIFKKYGAQWNGYESHWWWNDKYKSKEEILDLAKKAVIEGNKFLKQSDVEDIPNVSSFDDIQELGKIKEFLEIVRDVAVEVNSKSKGTTRDIVNSYIDELADSLDNQKLLDDIASYNKAFKDYILDTGKYSYSPRNIFLIWLQTLGTKAKVFGSIPYWHGRGYKPKNGAKKIYTLKPLSPNLTTVINRIIYNYPNSPKEFAKLTGFKITNSNNPIPKDKKHAFWVWAKEKGYVKNSPPKKYIDSAIYSDLDVEPIPNMTQKDEPETPKWYNDDDTEDDKAVIIIQALEMFMGDVGIKIDHVDDLGGAMGVSKGEHISLIAGNLSVGKLSTFIHEIAHEILHQPKNKNKFKELYLGRDNTPKERELHAESVAYAVMRSYDFPVKHSVTYLALWKANKDAVKNYQKAIRDTSFFIIKKIEEYAPKVVGDISHTLNETKKIIKNLLYGQN